MKKLIKSLLLATLMVASVASCIDDGIQEPLDAGICKEIAAIDDQVEAVEASMKDAKALSKALGAYEKELDGVVGAMKQHVSVLKAGLSQEASALATFELQKEIAGVVGTIRAQIAPEDYKGDLKAHFDALESGITCWLGNTFTLCYPMAFVNAVSACVMAEIEPEMQRQELYISALVSDVEAGLRKDEKPEELASLAASVKKNAEEAAQMSKDLAQMSEDVDSKYEAAVKAMCSSASEYDASELAALNDNVRMEVRAVDNSLAGLASRVAACESQLEDIQTRLGALELTVTDLNKLLEMIQSLTFMSEYSEEYAVAYYTMGYDDDPTQGSGIKKRTPDGTISLSYLVRPASAAAALATQSLWNDGLKVMSYYAQSLETKSVSLTGETITNVTADSQTGMVTVTIQNKLENNFFYKKVGAKMALSISIGKTDITSKFVEIVPKDKSGKVYLKNLTLSKDEVEIDEGDELNLYATVAPDDVYDRELVWTSSNNDIVSVSGAGRITGNAVGTATVTVTSKATDEWGKTMSATCSVKVNPAIKLSGPSYVEEGKNAELTLDFPPAMVIESKVWMSSDETKATVSNDGVVSGVAHTYNAYTYDYAPVTISCMVNGSITLTHDMKVVVPQPKQVKFDSYADDVKEVTMKVDQSISLKGTPDASADKFRMFYESNAGVGWIDSGSGLINGSSFTGTVYVYARVFENEPNHYFAPGKSLYREMIVKVEPYWVETITLPQTMTLAPGATATLTPTFTSDVDGKQPTNTSVTWTTSNSSIVSINATTGEMTAHAEGTVHITATTASGAAANSAVKTATCAVTVKAPVAEVKVGDYYYSDGTWGSDPNPSGKSVVGVIFSNVNAVASDPKLLADYPSCSNGLVVSTVEYSEAFGEYSYSDANASGIALHLDGSSFSQTIPNGYGLTQAYGKYRKTYSSNNYCAMFDEETGLPATHGKSVSAPSSAWYIPSYYEMVLMYENKDAVNTAISAVSGAQLGDKNYIHATLWTSRWEGKSYDDCTSKYFNMSTGTWGGTYTKGAKNPVRVVLAF